MATELAAKASLRTEDFSAGVKQIRERLTELNTALEKNKQELSENNKEAKKLQQEQKKLSEEMKSAGGGSDEQKRKMQELNDKIAQTTAKIGSLRAQEAELKSSVKSATKELDEQTGATKKVSDASDTAKTSVLNLGTAIKALIASAAAKTLWTSLIGSNAEMEQTLTSFTVMLGDAEKAKGLVKEMTEFAASTPLELPDVTAASQMLMNYGVAADEVIEKITRLGDLSSGNAAKLDRVSLAYGQMLAKGKVTGEELRQMTEAGVPLLQALADTLGKTTAEVQDMVSKSKVGIDDLDRAIESLTTGSGQFSGMMEKQSQTMTGMLSTARDLISKFGRDVGEEAFAEAKDALSDLLETIRELEEDGTLAEWAKTVGGGIADVLRWAKEAVSAILSAGEPIAELTKFVIENKEAVLAGIAAYKGFATVQTIIKGVTAATKEYAAAQGITLAGASKTTLATTAASAGISKLGAVLSSTSVQMGVLGIAIAAVVAEFNWLKQGFTVSEDVQRLADSVNDLKGSVEEAESSFAAEAAVLKTKAQAYEELRTKADRTATEEERLSELASELQETLGGNCTVVNALTGEYNDLTQAIDDYIKKQSASVRMSALEEQAKEAYKLIDEIEAKMEERKKKHEEWVENWNNTPIRLTDAGAYVETNNFLNDMESLRKQEADAKQIIADYEAAFGNYMQGISEDSEAAATAVQRNMGTAALSLEEIEKAAQDCRKATGELAKETKSLSSAFAEQNEDGSLSVDTILSLVDAGYAAALAVDAETGAVRLDTEAYKELAKAKIEAQKADLLEQRAQATQENIEKMKLAAGSGDHKRIAELQKENEAIVVEYDVQIAALDSIDLDKVTSGTYGEKKQSGSSGSGGSSGSKSAVKDVSGIESEMKSLSAAFKEQNESGEISIETANKLISLGYAQAVVTDKVTGKITLQGEEIKNLYDEKVEAAKKSESATQTEIDLLDLLKGKYGEVEEGVYGIKKANEERAKTVSELDSEMKTLSAAFAEQKASGEIGIETANKLISLGYAQAVVTDKVTGKITLQSEEIKNLYDEKVEASKKSENATQTEIDLLDLLKGKYGEVEAGIYGVNKATEKELADLNKAESSMRTLSEAFAEQKENGGLSADTISDLSGTRYAKALTVGVDGKVTLDTEKLEAELSEELDSAIRDLEEQLKTAEEGDIPALQAQIQAFKDLKSTIGEVTDGLYGVKKAAAEESAKTVSELESEMKTLSEAFAEQNENGTLSLSTIQKIIDLGYEEALEIDETTGKITLKKEAVESLLGAQTDETEAALEAERAEQEAAGKTVQGTNAKISVLKQLEKQLNEVTDGTYGVQTDYSDINKAFKEAADERIKAINDELSAKKKASEEAIAAIDAEIKARKRAKEDDDVQSEIDAVNAQLQYAQLDDFSRLQLERKLQGLQEQQADTAWERGAEDRKAAINAQYDLDEEKAAEEKERIKSGSEAVDQALKKAADGIELSAEEISAAVLAIQDVLKGFTGGAITQQTGTQLYQSTTDGRTFNTNVNFSSQGLTADQIARAVVDALMSEPIL